MRRHIVVALAGGVGAALAGLLSCSARADDGLTAQQIAFAARLVQQESGGNQIDVRTGAVLRSPAGARGLFQLMPGTAAHLGVNPDTAEGNVRGGLTEIVRLWNKYRGDKRLVAVAYNWGEAHADAIAAGEHVELPEETRSYVIAVVSGTSAPSSTTQPDAGPVQHVAAAPPVPPACAPSWDPWALASCSARLHRATTSTQPQHNLDSTSTQSQPTPNTETASR